MKNVLIAEDSRFMRTMIRQIIEQDEFRVIDEAEDGAEAISIFENNRPDIVLLDLPCRM
jgi:YesN/AraC family two-component response regulator